MLRCETPLVILGNYETLSFRSHFSYFGFTLVVIYNIKYAANILMAESLVMMRKPKRDDLSVRQLVRASMRYRNFQFAA